MKILVCWFPEYLLSAISYCFKVSVGECGGGVWMRGAVSKVCLHLSCLKAGIIALLALGGWPAPSRSDTVSADKALKMSL